ncbi:MAG: type II secretion system protein [Gammaproteobacteria bacterium]
MVKAERNMQKRVLVGERHVPIKAMRRASTSGFTLVELLIVVIILATLAAIVMPQLRGSVDEAKLASMRTNLATLRSAISMYYHQHGHYPGSVRSQGSCAVGTNTETATAGEAAFTAQLTQYTTRSGVACSQSDKESGGAIKYGPYLREIPVNPVTGSNALFAIKTGLLELSGTGTDTDGGWLYDFVTGEIVADQPSYSDY